MDDQQISYAVPPILQPKRPLRYYLWSWTGLVVAISYAIWALDSWNYVRTCKEFLCGIGAGVIGLPSSMLLSLFIGITHSPGWQLVSIALNTLLFYLIGLWLGNLAHMIAEAFRG